MGTGQRGARVAPPPPRQGSPSGEAHRPPLTLALPAPGPMGFMMVYMFSLELVESGGEQQGLCGWVRGIETPAHPNCHAPYLQGWA